MTPGTNHCSVAAVPPAPTPPKPPMVTAAAVGVPRAVRPACDRLTGGFEAAVDPFEAPLAQLLDGVALAINQARGTE